MKKQMKLFMLSSFFLVVCSGKLHAQNDNTVRQPDTSYTQSVTITDTTQNVEVVKEKKYAATEVIHYYSGKQEGNNIIKKVEVPLPEGTENFSDYSPR